MVTTKYKMVYVSIEIPTQNNCVSVPATNILIPCFTHVSYTSLHILASWRQSDRFNCNPIITDSVLWVLTI